MRSSTFEAKIAAGAKLEYVPKNVVEVRAIKKSGIKTDDRPDLTTSVESGIERRWGSNPVGGMLARALVDRSSESLRATRR